MRRQAPAPRRLPRNRSRLVAVLGVVLSFALSMGGEDGLAAPAVPKRTASAPAPARSAEADRGERLFKGEVPLPGRIWGHESDLPTQASRCTNCHALAAGPAPAASGPATPLGPTLSAASLTTLQRRRGGPPSRFDEDAFCRLLRTGVDPAEIVLPRVMPRYMLSPAQCHELWQYLSNVHP